MLDAGRQAEGVTVRLRAGQPRWSGGMGSMACRSELGFRIRSVRGETLGTGKCL